MSKERDIERLTLLVQTIISCRGVPGAYIEFVHVDGYKVRLTRPELHVAHSHCRLGGKSSITGIMSFDIWEIKGETLMIKEPEEIIGE
jgi:hypothetical protein